MITGASACKILKCVYYSVNSLGFQKKFDRRNCGAYLLCGFIHGGNGDCRRRFTGSACHLNCLGRRSKASLVMLSYYARVNVLDFSCFLTPWSDALELHIHRSRCLAQGEDQDVWPGYCLINTCSEAALGCYKNTGPAAYVSGVFNYGTGLHPGTHPASIHMH